MDSEDAAGVSAVGAHLLAKAGGQAGIFDWQILGPQPLVPVQSSNGLLGGGNQIFLIIGVVIRLFTAFANHLEEEGPLLVKSEGWGPQLEQETIGNAKKTKEGMGYSKMGTLLEIEKMQIKRKENILVIFFFLLI